MEREWTMGLFGNKKGKGQAKQEPAGFAVESIQVVPRGVPSISVRAWQIPPVIRSYRLPAEHEANVYTYNGEPFAGLRVNDRFLIYAVPADVEMVSAYTGKRSATGDYGDLAYEYNGQIFGFSSSHADAVRKLMQAGYRVEVEAYIRGFDTSQGFPHVVGLFGFVDDAVYSAL